MPWLSVLTHVLVLNVGFVLGAAWCGMANANKRHDRLFASPGSIPQGSSDAASAHARAEATERIGSES